MELFLLELRNRNPTFFTTHFIKILTSLAAQLEEEKINDRLLSMICEMLVKQLQISKSGTSTSIAAADHGLELLLRTIETFKGNVEINIRGFLN